MVKRTNWGDGAMGCPSAQDADGGLPPCGEGRPRLFWLVPVNWTRQDACCTGSGTPQELADRRERARWRSGAPPNFEAVTDASGPTGIQQSVNQKDSLTKVWTLKNIQVLGAEMSEKVNEHHVAHVHLRYISIENNRAVLLTSKLQYIWLYITRPTCWIVSILPTFPRQLKPSVLTVLRHETQQSIIHY